MKFTSLIGAGIALACAAASHGTLLTWQNQVDAVGTDPASTLFSTVSGAAPVLFDVGPLTGDRSFEFIVNSGVGGVSQALMGNQTANGAQGLKFEQWNMTGMYGMTNFNVVDLTSIVPTDYDRDVHIVFTADVNNVATSMYIDGALADTFLTGLQMQGIQGIGAATSPLGFFDVMEGDVLGFASYDSALSPAEISQHYDAFVFVPEPGSAALLALGSLVALRRRRAAA